jgi:hypothetical protein
LRTKRWRLTTLLYDCFDVPGTGTLACDGQSDRGSPISSISKSRARPKRRLLEARILNVKPPYANFYRAALGAVDRASQALNGGRRFAQLNEAERCSSDALPRPLSSRRRDRSRADWRAHRAKSFCNKICQNRKYSGSLIRARAHRSSRVLARRHDKVQSDQQKNLLNILNDSVISSRRVALVFMREECSAYSCDRSVRYHRTTR